MKAEGWQRVEAVFEATAVLLPGERTAALARLCDGDLELRREVEALLAADGDAGLFLSAPAVARLAAAPALPAGHRLGPYRIEGALGEGGMSTVYLASRDDREYEGKVAIKVFTAGTARADLLVRFRAERQILAALDHPGIARLLDGGTTEEGLPYLVMEYIDGLPIDRFCDERRLSVEARIELFRQVCAAVAHAHRNLVVHRDLKPSNILVTSEETPRLFDFGIAKLLEGAAVVPPAQATVTGQRWMTPLFASPEQVVGRPVTTVSDVYGLGVLLYLLLTGAYPYRYDAQRLGALEQAVVEQEPERPSLAAARAGAAAAEARGLRPRQLAARLAGDLDNVLRTALAKEPQRRYGSVEALSEDLRRFLAGLPVEARAGTFGYHLRKFVARHRWGVAAGTAAAGLVVTLAVTMTVQAAHLARQRDEIQRERDKAVEVTRFLKEMFQLSDPEAHSDTVTARQLLDTGTARLRIGLAGQPETQAALLATAGAVYHNLGLDERALPLLQQALALRRATFGEAHPEVADSLDALGLYHLDRGEPVAAEAVLRQAVALRRRVQGTRHPAVASSANGLAGALLNQARYKEAEPLLEEALSIELERLGPAHEQTAESLAMLGSLRDAQGDFNAAAELLRRALAIIRRHRGPAHPETASLLNNLGLVLARQGDLTAAEAALRESLAIARRAYGREHLEVAMRLNNLELFYLERGEPARAEPLGREALAMLRRLLGNDNPRVALALHSLARVVEEKGDLAAAERLYREALAAQRRLLGPRHPDLALTLSDLAGLLGDRGQAAAGEPMAREALAIRRAALGDAHPDVGTALVTLGNLRLARGAPEEAEALLRQGLAHLRHALPGGRWRTAWAESALGACLAARGKREEAGPLLRSGYETLLRTRGERARATIIARARIDPHPRRAPAFAAR